MQPLSENWREWQPEAKQKMLARLQLRPTVTGTTSRTVWQPQPGPQAAAFASTASVVGYGGAAGGGKTDLGLGLACAPWHHRAIIFRRVFPNARGIVERSRELWNTIGRLNESLHIWRLDDAHTIEIGSLPNEDDKTKHQGQARDLHVFDEATEFSETQVRFVTGWSRSTKAGVRPQVLLTFNPPMNDAGAWVERYFAPWLEKDHPHRAQDGELRWYVTDKEGKDQAVSGPEPVEIEGKSVNPRSRTFFHAALKDNPILEATGYESTIDSLPEPLRSFLRGNFDAAKIADPWQTIPAAWVRLAQKRWSEQGRPENSVASVGVDPARGGGDKMAISRLYGTWYAEVETWPGTAVPDGPTAAALLASDISNGASLGVDVIGIGSSVYDSLKDNNAVVQAINFAAGAQNVTDRSGRLKFRNVRAAAYWLLREALDPDHGEGVALPPDSELLADLCAPRYDLKPSGIQLEDKDDIKERIGRSPDKGDAVVLAWWTALYGASSYVAW